MHLLDPTTAERHHAIAFDIIWELLAAASFGMFGGGFPARLTLEVVDRQTGTAVLTMHELYDSAKRLANMIDSDLDRLDAEQFAAEWSLQPSPHPRT